LLREAAVDADDLTGNKARRIGSEKLNKSRNVPRRAKPAGRVAPINSA
jgi:hypothetical protein